MITWTLSCYHKGSSSDRAYAPSYVGGQYFCGACCSYREVVSMWNSKNEPITGLPWPRRDNYNG